MRKIEMKFSIDWYPDCNYAKQKHIPFSIGKCLAICQILNSIGCTAMHINSFPYCHLNDAQKCVPGIM